MIKILHMIDSLVMGGKERRLVELLKNLQHTSNVDSGLAILSKTVDYTYVNKLDVPIYYLKRSRKKDLTIFPRLKKLCEQVQPDIIHSWESMCSVYAAPVARLLNIRFINAMITNSSQVKRFGSSWLRAKLTFPFSHLILANSQAGLSSYNAPVHKSRYVHNGFDFSRLERIEPPSVYRQKHDISTPKVVGMVATFDSRKDYESFVLIANDILTRRKDVTFVALGGGPTLEHCRQLVSPRVSDRVKFLGRQSNIESYINLFDVAVLLTNPEVHGEGISNSIMEYMALAKPVIATRGGGTGEIVDDKRTGFLVEPADLKDLSRKIQFLLDNEQEAKKMGHQGREVVQHSFSIEKMTQEIVNNYTACLQNR